MFGSEVRASAAERLRTLPGDELVSPSIGSLTHAITINAPVAAVWPWLAQMGAGRGGWYSYDILDNGGQPSADRVLPEYQLIEVGTLMPALPGITEGFNVRSLDPTRSLVLGWGSASEPQHTTWAFVLEQASSDVTRLIVRARAGPGYRLFGIPPALSQYLAGPVHWIMQRKQLNGIKQRAERARTAGG
ncbi:MAG TPA: hypothetical protein VEI06_10685 [Gemmatimonadaceae bacterium]|nr:hypothetical protein [Gemmatimonadaceae bacterium]